MAHYPVDLRELPDTLLKKQGTEGAVTEQPTTSLIGGKYVALYFSAHWCPPCRAFTPQLKRTYMILTAKDTPVEFIFVSLDNSMKEFTEYFETMPWAAVKYEDTKFRQQLGERFRVSGIPALVVLGPDGRVVNNGARTAVLKDPEGERFPWEGEEDSRLGGPNYMFIAFLVVVAAWILYNSFMGPKTD